MASSPSEHEIQQRIRLACGRGAVRLWRNNTGALVDQQGRLARFGLCKGSSDLIGLRSLEITPEMAGQRVAQFVALEVKTASGVVSPEQRSAALWRRPSSCLAARDKCCWDTDGSGRTAAAAEASRQGPPRRAPLHHCSEIAGGDREGDHWAACQVDPAEARTGSDLICQDVSGSD